MGIPAGFAFYAETLLGFVTAENIFHRTGHHVMDTGHSVGRWGTFEEGKCLMCGSLGYTLFKDASFFPKLKDFFFYFWPIEFRECRIHKIDIS